MIVLAERLMTLMRRITLRVMMMAPMKAMKMVSSRLAHCISAAMSVSSVPSEAR